MSADSSPSPENSVKTPTGPFGPLRLPVFRDRVVASLVSNTGSWMQDTAATWLMTALSASQLPIALMQTAASFERSARSGFRESLAR